MAEKMVQGGWYGGRQYWNGNLGPVNVVMNPSDAGYGKQVSNEVISQTNPKNVDYIAGLLSGGGGPSSSQAGVPGMPGGSGASPRLDFVNKQVEEFKRQDAERAAKSASAVKELQDFYAGLEPATARFNRLRDEHGVDDQTELVNNLTKNVMDTEDLIMGLEDSVNTRSGDFLMNDADRTAVLARERAPLQDNLTKLLRSKQYEEVGLAGKQQLVSELLALSYKDDEMRAKPLQLGVDYTEKDRQTATELFKAILDRTSSAFSGDQDAYEESVRNARDFEQQKELENLKHKNDIALKQTASASSGSSTTKKNAQNTFNTFLGNSTTEYDVWKKIDQAQKSGQYSKEELNELWALHAELKAKTGQGGNVRSGGTTSFDFSDL